MATLSKILKKSSEKTLRNRSGEGNTKWIEKRILAASKDKKYASSKPRIGQMFTFLYDAKHKKTLPYWDAVPLVIPIEMYGNGFLGLNLHYLPIRERTFLLMKLMALADEPDENTKLKVSYSLMAGISKYKTAKPCIHRYLYNHFKSKLIRIPVVDYFDVIKLPMAHFQGAGKARVYKESRERY